MTPTTPAIPETPSQPTIAVVGGGRFPVRRVYCVGRNYAAHAREMGADPSREAPFFFSKPADAITQEYVVPYPPVTEELHHEVELVVALSTGGAGVATSQAKAMILGYGVGVDLTRRDVQAVAKSKGRPWDLAKGFDHSAPVSNLVPASQIGNLKDDSLDLSVNGVLRQQGTLDQMIWQVEEVIAALSAVIRLQPGDLIFTGTPSGVGSLAVGDVVTARLGDQLSLEFKVGETDPAFTTTP